MMESWTKDPETPITVTCPKDKYDELVSFKQIMTERSVTISSIISKEYGYYDSGFRVTSCNSVIEEIKKFQNTELESAQKKITELEDKVTKMENTLVANEYQIERLKEEKKPFFRTLKDFIGV